MRPGINVQTQDSPPNSSPPTDTGQTFAGVVCERGPTGSAFAVNTFAEAKAAIGTRFSWNARYYDGIEKFYQRGGSRLFLSRIVGPAAARATARLLETGAEESLNAEAIGAGEFYNGIQLRTVAQGENVQIVVSHREYTEVSERSPYAATQEELINWARNSRYIRLALGRSARLPRAAVTIELREGRDDRANITDRQKVESLAAFNRELGPGQVTIPGATTRAAWEGALTHAREFGRDAILSYPDTEEEATLRTLAEEVRGLGRYGAAFAGWLVYPGEAVGTSKTVAPDMIVCACIAANDAATNGLGQNQAIAGFRRGVIAEAEAVTQGESRTWRNEEARERLNAAGVNLIRETNNRVLIFGWRSLVEEVRDPGWTNFGHRRLHTALVAKCEAALEDYIFEEINRRLLKEIQGIIASKVLNPYFVFGSLDGETPERAYEVETESVNNAETAERKEVNIAVTVVEGEYAEVLNVVIHKNLIREGIGS